MATELNSLYSSWLEWWMAALLVKKKLVVWCQSKYGDAIYSTYQSADDVNMKYDYSTRTPDTQNIWILTFYVTTGIINLEQTWRDAKLPGK
ncbi:MAG: hypothetical protein AB2693_22010 [Candidatus Thiodiazotropha sp.]